MATENENGSARSKGTPTPEQAPKARINKLTSEEALAWLKKHLANAPERSEEWYREVLAIYRAGRREAVAEQPPKRVA